MHVPVGLMGKKKNVCSVFDAGTASECGGGGGTQRTREKLKL